MTRKERVAENGCTAMKLHGDNQEEAIAWLERDRDRLRTAWQTEKNPIKAKAYMAQEKEVDEAISSLHAGNYNKAYRKLRGCSTRYGQPLKICQDRSVGGKADRRLRNGR